MTKPEIIRVLDAKNEDDRKYAQENLIGCWVGHDMNAWGAEYPQCKTLKKVLMDEFHLWTRSDYSCSQYICEFSNSRPKNMSQNNNENDKTLCNKCNGVVVDCWGSRLDIQYRENVYCQACYEKALNSSITLKSNNCMKCSSLIVPTEAYCETCYDDQTC